MSETAIACLLVALAALICFTTQMAAWKVGLRFTREFGKLRRFLWGAAIGGTVFVVGVSAVIQLVNGKFDLMELILTGAACAGFFVISHLALTVAIRRQERKSKQPLG